MEEQENLVLSTHYFTRPWTWIKRAFVFLCILVAIAYFDSIYPDGFGYKILFITFCAFIIIAKPKDELTLSRKYLFHIRRSIVPWCTRIDKYSIEEMESISCGGIYSNGFEFSDFLGYGNWNAFHLMFKDKRSVTLNLRIYRNELDHFARVLREIIASNNISQRGSQDS